MTFDWLTERDDNSSAQEQHTVIIAEKLCSYYTRNERVRRMSNSKYLKFFRYKVSNYTQGEKFFFDLYILLLIAQLTWL